MTDIVSLYFIKPDGSEHKVEAEIGICVMRAAINNGLNGIVAECGGTASCGTCHVYVESDWLCKFPAPTDNEQTMLEFTASPATENSRLSCQLVVSAEHEGAVFRLPERQV